MIFDILKIILLCSWIFIVPSFLLAQLSKKKSIPAFVFNLSLTFVFLPIVTYYILLLTGKFLTLANILLISTVCNLGIFFFWFQNKKKFRKISIRGKRVLITLMTAVFIFSLLTFSFPHAQRYSCPDSWAYKNIKGDYTFWKVKVRKVISVPGTGNTQITSAHYYGNYVNEDLNISGWNNPPLQYVTIQPQKESILKNYLAANDGILLDEPYSIGIHPSYFLALFNFFGWRLLYSFIMVCSSGILFFLSMRFTDNRILSILAVILLNTTLIAGESNSINPNLFAMMLVIMIIFVMTGRKISGISYIIAGATYGFLGSIRPVTLVFLPGFIMYFLYHFKQSNKARDFLLFFFASLAVISPVLLMNFLLYHNPIQFPGFIHTKLIEHSFFGLDFSIRTLLNFPFNDHIVRSPNFPFPTFIYLPLFLLKSLGVILFIPILFGFMGLKEKKDKYLFISIPLIFLLFLGINENWITAKTTLLLLILPFMIVLSIRGISEIKERIRSWKVVGSYLLILMIILFSLVILRRTFFPIDERMKEFYYPNYLEDRVFVNDRKIYLTEISFLPGLAGKEMHLWDLAQDMIEKKAEPPLFQMFFSCYAGNITISPYSVFQDKGKLFVTIPYLYDGIDTSHDISVFNLSGGDMEFEDVSTHGHCYSFDLRIIQDEETVSFILQNFSNYVPGATLEKKVEIVGLYRPKRILIIEDDDKYFEYSYYNR